MAVLVAMYSIAVAQAPPERADEFTIQGSVLDSAGKPVRGASVKLEQKSGSGTVTTTDTEGAFIFSAIRLGTYFLSAEKSGLQSPVVTVAESNLKDHAQARLVLDTANVVHTASGKSASSSSETMAFADAPNFTVAGITDWTAVGGHGSDASLRTSEALARDTSTLSPARPGCNASSSALAGTTGASETELRAALAQAPGSFEANHRLGKLYFCSARYPEAIPLLRTAYQVDPVNHGNGYDLAVAYEETGDFSQARDLVQKLLAHEDSADLHRLMGALDEEMGDSLAAVREDEKAVRLDPDEQNYFAWGSELLLHRAVWPAAEVFKKGAAAHPKSARMLAALGAALFASALYDEAALHLCAASDLDPADPAPYVFLGKIDIAAPAPLACVKPKLMQFAREQPQDARANYYLAMAIWKRQKPSENPHGMQQVVSLLTKAVAINPKYDEAYLQLGIYYASVERNFEKAIGFYLKAIEIDPQLGEAHYRLGVSYEKTGESAKAKQEFQLHDEIEKLQAASVERQRREVKQFLVVLQGQPTVY